MIFPARHVAKGGGMGGPRPPKTESGPSKTVLGPLIFGVKSPKSEPGPPKMNQAPLVPCYYCYSPDCQQFLANHNKIKINHRSIGGEGGMLKLIISCPIFFSFFPSLFLLPVSGQIFRQIIAGSVQRKVNLKNV